MKYICLSLILFLGLVQKTLAQVPQLNSYPSAAAVLYLDFDGQTVVGTSWNGNGPLFCNGANLDAAQITEIFNRVSEDYRPFNINITTDSTKYWAAPATQRTRVILTTSSSWFGNAGGVAYTNSFTWGDNTPCFVFTALLNYNAKFIGEAASHEAGHTLGLNHQSAYDNVCNKTAEYNAGIGSGEIGWAPIMGVGYYRNQTLWHYGSNPFGCMYMQDDLGVITNEYNGFGFRADDHGNTTATATVASFNNNQFLVNGIIEKPNDSDMIQFTLDTRSRFQLNALPYSIGPNDNGANVDLQVELINGRETETVVYNPAETLSASLDTVLNAGTYYLRVKSTGNAYAPDFASLGSYTLGAKIDASTLPLHKLVLKADVENGQHKLDWEIVADEAIIKQTVEMATDGSNFQAISDVATSARSFRYQATKATLQYYRLNVLFDNGRRYYSNVVALRGTNSNRKPSLLGNVVSGTLAVNSPSDYQYIITDMSGRTLAKGQLAGGINNLATGFLSRGLYLLQITNQQEQYTEKFMKQ